MRLAICQASATLADKAKNIATVHKAARAAACWEADLLVLPELFLTGYNIGSRATELAEAANGPSLAAISEIAARESCSICIGFAERDGKSVFNSSVLFDAEGNLVALYRKIHLFGPKEQELFTAGDELVVARLGDHTIGMAICYDIEFPEFARGLKRRGADLIVAPTANMLPFVEVPTTFVRARALENGLFLAYANHCGAEAELEYTGMSGICGPDGLDIARAGIRGEALLLAELPTSYPAGSLSTQLDDLRLPPEK
ncbi:MAG: carbon-nitrogen hydrolase family protein [Proteobacteria bacterium]|nr:carbon-nitrogen hydrolase family protein [Pseudomonadota bacterium]